MQVEQRERIGSGDGGGGELIGGDGQLNDTYPVCMDTISVASINYMRTNC